MRGYWTVLKNKQKKVFVRNDTILDELHEMKGATNDFIPLGAIREYTPMAQHSDLKFNKAANTLMSRKDTMEPTPKVTNPEQYITEIIRGYMIRISSSLANQVVHHSFFQQLSKSPSKLVFLRNILNGLDIIYKWEWVIM